MDKFLKFSKHFSILIACSLLVVAFTIADYSLGQRIVCILVACIILAFIYISSFRNLLLTVFFFLLSVAELTLVFEDGSFVWSAALLEVAFFCTFVCFFRKVFRNIRMRRMHHINMYEIDHMTGIEFEHFTANLLSKLGYTRISVTKASGDQGIDVIAYKDGLSYAIQCKHYSSSLGNTAVQEAYTGKAYYGCCYAVVCTNNYFTAGAKELASSTGVLLWDRSVLQEMLLQAGVLHLTSTRPVVAANHVESANGIDGTSFAQSNLKVPSSESYTKPTCISDNTPTPTPTLHPPFCVDDKFIAEAQWYAARGGADLTEDE